MRRTRQKNPADRRTRRGLADMLSFLFGAAIIPLKLARPYRLSSLDTDGGVTYRPARRQNRIRPRTNSCAHSFQGAKPSMWTRNSKMLLTALFAALIFSKPSRTALADKRKPGLYWTFDTDNGKIACKLYEAEAPVTVRTMVGLAIGKLSYVQD